MKVRELRAMLVDLENNGQGEVDVVFSYNYGDRWRTIVASDVTDCQEVTVKYSEYYQMNKVVDEEDYGDTPGLKKVICIS